MDRCALWFTSRCRARGTKGANMLLYSSKNTEINYVFLFITALQASLSCTTKPLVCLVSLGENCIETSISSQ